MSLSLGPTSHHEVMLQLFYRHVTFLCGRAGVYAIGAVVAHYRNDHQRRHLFLGLFIEVSISISIS